MIEKLTRKTRQRVPEQTPRNKTESIRDQRRRSERHLSSGGAHPSTAERRRSLPIFQTQPTESKTVQRTRKAMAAAAATLNVFPPERRLEMLEAATQLRDSREAVAPKRVPMRPDAQGDRYMHFELLLDDEENIFVAENIRRTADDGGANERSRVHAFSADELRRAGTQLNRASIWLASNELGFHEPRPDFPPLNLALTLSVD
jgi:hypothetical protein